MIRLAVVFLIVGSTDLKSRLESGNQDIKRTIEDKNKCQRWLLDDSKDVFLTRYPSLLHLYNAFVVRRPLIHENRQDLDKALFGLSALTYYQLLFTQTHCFVLMPHT